MSELTLEEIEKWRAQFIIDEIRVLSQADCFSVGSVATLERIDWLIQEVNVLNGEILGWKIVEGILKERVKELEGKNNILTRWDEELQEDLRRANDE